MGLFGAIKSFLSFGYNVLEGAPLLTPEQDRGLAMGAVYAVEGYLPINALTTDSDQRTAAALLQNAWNTVDTNSARETYRFLLNGGHATVYGVMQPYLAPLIDALMDGRRTESDAAFQRGLRELPGVAAQYGLDPAQVHRYFDNWRYTYLFGGHLADRAPRSIVAWDAARLAHVSRMFVDAGYIQPAEAWSAISLMVDLSRQTYTSWQEFSDAFLYGRIFWQMGLGQFDPEQAAEDLEGFESASERLLTRDDSPWKRLPW